jgi:hypothetical protein
VSENRTSDKVDYSAGRDDLEKLLVLAEQLQRQSEETSMQFTKQILFTGFALAVGCSSILLGAMRFDFIWKLGINALPVLVLLVACVMLGITYVQLISLKASRRVRRDRRALAEIVELLRETSGVIARRDAWSKLDEAEFRIRLSRFDVERGSDERRTHADRSSGDNED